MKAMLEVLVKGLVDNPDEVRIDEARKGSQVTLEVNVADNDLGKVIGKDGRIANALRQVVAALGDRESLSTNVEIMS